MYTYLYCEHKDDDGRYACVNPVIVRVHVDCPDPEDTHVQMLCGRHLVALVAVVADDMAAGAPAPDLSVSAHVGR